MLTAFGKYCRKLRIDHGEILKDMADKLGVTSAYLSAVENGKRSIPNKWLSVLSNLYQLSPDQIMELNQSINDSKTDLKIELIGSSQQARNTAIAFAREFNTLSEDDFEAISKILKERVDRR